MMANKAATKHNNNGSSLSWRLEAGLLLGILLLAAVLRIGWPGLTEFKADEARLTLLALEMAEGVRFPLRGISSSVGFPNFPMSVWLYALPLFAWRHVYSATLFTGFLNILAVAGCYWLARRYWGPRAALTAALMFAVSPWALHHSRKIWAQNLLAPFVVGWGISGALTFVEKRPSFIIPHLLCLVVAVQIHLAGVALVPVTAVLMLLYRRRLTWRHTLLGGALAGLTLIPFAVYLLRNGSLISDQGDSLGAALTLAASTGRGWDAQALRYAWLLSSGQEIHALAGPVAFERFLTQVPDMTAVHWLWGGLMLGGILWLAWQLRRDDLQQRDLSRLLLLWLIVPILFFTWPHLPAELHYLLPIYPVPYIAAGIFVDRIIYRRGRGEKTIKISALSASLAVSFFLIGTAVAQVWVWVRLLLFVSQVATPGGFGVPLAQQLEAAALVRQQAADANAAEILIVGPGDNPAEDEFSAIYDVLLRDVPHRFVDGGKTAVFPQAQAVAFLAPGTVGAADLYRETAVANTTIPPREGEGALSILTLPQTQPTPDTGFDPPHILTNWAALAGHDIPEIKKDGTAVWRVYWYAGESTEADFHLFNHLLNDEGERLSQADTAVFPASQWQAGDLVITQVTLSWPETAVAMRVGMYRFPGLEPVHVFDVAGNPTSNSVIIPLSKP